jgi:multiple sugar transport system permease protein
MATVAPTLTTTIHPSAPKHHLTVSAGVRKTLFYVLLLAMVVVFITPYLFALMAAFKPLSEVTTDKAWQLPHHFTWTNFSNIFSKYDFGNYLLNTLIVTVILTIGQVTFSLMGAYAFARLKFPGREALFWVYLAMLMVPNVVTMIPLYVIMSRIGLINTYWAIFLPYVLGTPYAVFLMRQYLLTIPGEVIEAARLDGCSDL